MPSQKRADDDSASYADRTRNDPNPIKRLIQRDRFREPLKLLTGLTNVSVLDYGAGDGELMRRIAASGITAGPKVAFEPSPAMQPSLEANLRHTEDVEIVTDSAVLCAGNYDWVFSLEVLEHIPEEQMESVLEDIARLTHKGSRILIAVPMEIHLPALFKGLFRMVRRWGAPDASVINVLRATLGRAVQRPRSTMGADLPYHFEHIGFDYRQLERRLERRFNILERWCRPLPWLGRVLNSEIYFLLSPKSSEIPS